MLIRGLKAKIAINIAVLLFLAMLLVDLVTIVTVRRELIRSEVFKANSLLTSFEDITVLEHHRVELSLAKDAADQANQAGHRLARVHRVEQDALGRHAVQARGLDVGLPVAPEVRPPQVVGHDVDDVWPLDFPLLARYRRTAKKQ